MMTATEYQLGQRPAPHVAERADGIADDSWAGARWRLILAVLWLAGQVAWGLFSHLATDRGDDSGGGPWRAAQPLDGHGKWTGY